MSETKRVKPLRRSSNSSLSSRASNVSFSEKVRRESTAKFDDFMKECRAAYLAVLSSTTEKITSIDELILALQFGGRNPSKKVVQKYWKHETDSISYNDFCDIMRKEKPPNEDSLLKAFKCIDKNGDGYITSDELFNLLTKQGERMTKSEVQAILDDADTNNDGKLDYIEFTAMLLATSEDYKQKSLKRLAQDDDNVVTSARNPSFNKRAILCTQRSHKPDNLKDWSRVFSKGSFFISMDGVISSHQYKLQIPRDSEVFITIHQMAKSKVVDHLRKTDMAVLQIITIFLQEFCLRCELSRGSYSLITFTTGCHLTVRDSQPLKKANLSVGSGENLQLSKVFRETLVDVFERSDLDDNGYLSRDEFDLFQLKSGGDLCDDEAWQVMKENFDMKDDEITLEGFLELNTMEAQDADGDPNDLWVTLGNMGYNKALELDQVLFSGESSQKRASRALKQPRHRLRHNVSRNPGQEMCDLNLMYQYPFQFELNVLQVVYHFVPHDARREWSVKHVLTIEK
ncbi:PREDICTED: EF-hand calcium-binding domain-containing protein 7-like [Acropora digitifera]|uniref:EF-hand calcium-binding domain-containing protein 7-like n=1 Tax=Acropora digitifera TaxID=70779 RepID=UPI00077A303F|nr:PREDICTED: EF-hand calcium-binding domain-containing protein 7-like [Acropora digitifera]